MKDRNELKKKMEKEIGKELRKKTIWKMKDRNEL